jgi:hypothetical protein
MSIRIYIGNLPQVFNPKEFDSFLKTVSDSIRFKQKSVEDLVLLQQIMNKMQI